MSAAAAMAPIRTEDPKWERSTVLVLAMHNCTSCFGSGTRISLRRSATSPCNCVLRAIFRICFEKFIQCVTQERHLSHVSLEPHAGRSRPSTWGRKDEEYIADFTLVARRVLSDVEWTLFELHYLFGKDWTYCTLKTDLDRGNFFHAIYRIEQKLGRMFRELEPYALFPLDEYFRSPSRMSKPFPAQTEEVGKPLRPPLSS